jgi:dTDP-4-amino-4,6-dideoxygalactose transaminase
MSYCGAQAVFLDSDKTTLGMSPDKMAAFLEAETVVKDDGNCYNIRSGRRIAACVPVHIFGHPVQVDKINALCEQYHIPLIEDAAESLGSFYKAKHTGTYGRAGILSFNGNKPVTTGGGGMIITDDELLASGAKHITTTAKVPHKWEFIHDEVGYNYRLPNINAALGCAQMELFPQFLENKRQLAAIYKDFLEKKGVNFISEGPDCRSNYWLNAIILKDRNEQDEFLQYAHSSGVMCRPVWRLMSDLEMYKHCQTDELENAKWFEERVVNIPSSVRM